MSSPLVLMWHGFGDREDATDPHRLFVPAHVFANQLDTLAARGSRFLGLDEYLEAISTGRWPPRSVLVTIDDGYASALTEAAPLLAARGVPSVLFALAGLLGGTSTWMPDMPDEPLLDADGLRELQRYGVRVEAHGWDHAPLPGLSPLEMHRQVADARMALADVLGRQPVAFAYPCGHHNSAAQSAVRAAGYECAFGVHGRALDRWALPRVDVNPTDTRLSFLLKSSKMWPVAYDTVGRLTPVRRGLHRMVGFGR